MTTTLLLWCITWLHPLSGSSLLSVRVTAPLNCGRADSTNWPFLCWHLLTLEKWSQVAHPASHTYYIGREESKAKLIGSSNAWVKYSLVERHQQVFFFICFFCQCVQLERHGAWKKRRPLGMCRRAPGTLSENQFQSKTQLSQNLWAGGSIGITLQSD